jgi:hypothetical protein
MLSRSELAKHLFQEICSITPEKFHRLLASKIFDVLEKYAGADPLDLYEIAEEDDIPILFEEANRRLLKGR